MCSGSTSFLESLGSLTINHPFEPPKPPTKPNNLHVFLIITTVADPIEAEIDPHSENVYLVEIATLPSLGHTVDSKNQILVAPLVKQLKIQEECNTHKFQS